MDPDEQLELRRRTLASFGEEGAIEAVLQYNANPFAESRLPPPVFPLPDEPHVADWRAYAGACGLEAFPYLQSRLPQLCIPISAGVSATEAYARVVRRGQPFDAAAFGGRLALERPEDLRIRIYEHATGALPVLMTGHRSDFVALDRALACRSEPVDIGPAVNAHLVSGVPNWDRLRRYQATWAANHPEARDDSWLREMKCASAEEPALFYDRLVLACDGPYSNLRRSARPGHGR